MKRLTFQKKKEEGKAKQGMQENVGSCGGLALDGSYGALGITR